MPEDHSKSSDKNQSCSSCGAELNYKPGSKVLKCNYCGHNEPIILDDTKSVLELDLKKYLEEMGSSAHSQEVSMVHCNGCGADQHVEDHIKTLNCVFCGNILKIQDQKKEEWILPGGIIPFKLDRSQADALFNKWVSGLWFAPNKFKKATLNPDHLQGIYIPYWTFDANMNVQYSGQRGTYYFENKTRTVRVNGRTERRTEQVRRTSWTPTSGVVNGFIDDTLIIASESRKRQVDNKVANWDLKQIIPFDSKFLAGYITEKYSISLDKGHLASVQEAEQIAVSWARNDIGGDEQRVNSLNKTLSNETFKHILLPLYLSNYKFEDKVYPFYINGQTGQLSGKRPYSAIKIALAIICGLIIVGLFVFVVSENQ